MAAMKWNDVLTLRSWPSLQAIAPNAVRVKDNLLRVSAEQFVVISSHDRELRDDNPDAPFITAVIWAPDKCAALRCALHEIEYDSATAATVRPPGELLPFDAPPTYAKITQAARTRRYGDYLEHAEYRMAPSGAAEFVHKVVEVGRIGYCFRSAATREAEWPYAIRVSLIA